jgi:pSer/pThr/pTyr-binding forkhead associated (FHA) protein
MQLSGEGGKGRHRSLAQYSNQSPNFPLMEDVTITISVIEGPSKGLIYEMKEYCVTLGRTGGGADFQFDEPEASEIQCIAAKRQNGLCLYDAVSIHGTYINDQRIAAAELTHMSTFRVGSSLLLVKVHPKQPVEIC